MHGIFTQCKRNRRLQALGLAHVAAGPAHGCGTSPQQPLLPSKGGLAVAKGKQQSALRWTLCFRPSELKHTNAGAQRTEVSLYPGMA